MSRYASFLFSFIGRGVCKLLARKQVCWQRREADECDQVYVFIGSIIVSDAVRDKIAGTLVGLVGIAYIVLE